MIEQVQSNPTRPIHWGLNQSGMQAKDEQANCVHAYNAWINARNDAIKHAKKLQALGLHKQIVNRVLEPFQIVKTLVTSTDYDNFFTLRRHKDAQPEIRELANLMYEVMQVNKPEMLRAGEWHTPYVQHERNKDDLIYIVDDKPVNLETAIKISCSCSAQVSYRKNDTSIEKAIKIYDKLIGSEPKHASAFEHCATPIDPSQEDEIKEHSGITHWLSNSNGFTACSGNFKNWVQYRQLIK